MPEPMRTPVRSCFSGVSAFEPESVDRLLGGRHGVDDEVVDLALLLRLHPLVGIELAVGRRAARNEAGDLAGDIGYLELLDPARAALAASRLDHAARRRSRRA